ncbi:Uncharacterised protein [Mycobacteroides abscessus subsp. abscessus]|nr:Uncharacterised protein [Mycobacteroides abscessus subsp. abscessus]
MLDFFAGLLILRYQGAEVGEDLRIAHRLPVGRKQFGVALDIEQLLADQDELLGKDGVMFAPQGGELAADGPVGDLAQRGTHGAGDLPK